MDQKSDILRDVSLLHLTPDLLTLEKRVSFLGAAPPLLKFNLQPNTMMLHRKV